MHRNIMITEMFTIIPSTGYVAMYLHKLADKPFEAKDYIALIRIYLK